MQLLFLTCVTSSIATSDPRFIHPLGQLPHYKPVYCDPNIPPICANITGPGTLCVEDKEYPLYQIKNAIDTDYLFAKKYSDLPHQSADDLVDKVTREQEEAFHAGYALYTGATTGHSPLDLTHWSGPEGYICPSSAKYIMPKRARNVEGHWRVIVNVPSYYTQTIRWERCLYPESACRALPACYNSHCTQKFTYHRLLSFDLCDPYKGLFIDIFRFQSACSCHVSKY